MGYGWEDRTERIPHVPAAEPPRPAKARPERNVAAIVAIACAAVGLLIVPILLGPAAIIAGAVGANASRAEHMGGQKLSILAVLVGLLEIVHILTA